MIVIPYFRRKAKRSGSNIFQLFSQKQIQEFKEAFGIMDTDKDGIISASDLEKAFANVGKSVSGGDASNMLSEAPGPVNFTQLVTLFAEKMAGGETWKRTHCRLGPRDSMEPQPMLWRAIAAMNRTKITHMMDNFLIAWDTNGMPEFRGSPQRCPQKRISSKAACFDT